MRIDSTPPSHTASPELWEGARNESAGEALAMLKDMWAALGQPLELLDHLRIVGEGDLPSVYGVTALATGSIGAAALSMADLLSRRHGHMPDVEVDRALACCWFAQSIQPQAWMLPPPWDAIAGDYETRDGWIKLHTNAPKHRAAALRALGLEDDSQLSRAVMALAVKRWSAVDLETAVVAQGGCAAEMRSVQAWSVHPQGIAVATEPLLRNAQTADGAARVPDWTLDPDRPLRGIRVLDLTRILAGPIATRFLAGFGAEVLRIDPIDWDEPVVAPEVTLGKKRARLDLRSTDGRARFESLLASADVLVHGYRADALEKLGLGIEHRRFVNPGLIDVSLDAYGWTGPWHLRRGFDSLVQMSAGIAEAGMRLQGLSKPTPLPVQALDHATGYLLAAAVLRGLALRVDQGCGSRTRTSLARMAKLLTQHSAPRSRDANPVRKMQACDHASEIESTPWGPARRLLPPYAVSGAQVYWTLPAGNLGDGDAAW